MIEDIERIETLYFNKWGESSTTQKGDSETVRLSVYITPDDSHHIEIPVNESRFRLSGLLIRLAKMVAEGVRNE